MMSVLIECGDDAVALGATLATLVPGAVEGLVREVLVVDRGLDVATRNVADHAGCWIVSGDAAARALRVAKGDWIMLIQPGARLVPGWIEAVTEHVANAGADGAPPKAARFSPPGDGRSFPAWLLLRRRNPLAHGLILPKAQAIELYGKGETFGRPAARRLAAVIRPRGDRR